MSSPFDKAYNSAICISRTEGHCIQQQSALDGLHKAREKGADIVKQWDATLDSATRPWHQEADGQLRELDEDFDVGGDKMKAPGGEEALLGMFAIADVVSCNVKDGHWTRRSLRL